MFYKESTLCYVASFFSILLRVLILGMAAELPQILFIMFFFFSFLWLIQ